MQILMRRLVTSRLIWIYIVFTDICFSLSDWKKLREVQES